MKFQFVSRLILIALLFTTLSLTFTDTTLASDTCADQPPVTGKIKHKYFVSPTGSDNHPGTFKLPFRTLEKARDKVRSVRCAMTKDITVFLRGGTYGIQTPLVLNEYDSGANGFRIHWRNYGGEYVEINGGYQIMNWQLIPNTSIWKASTPDIEFRQLYVDGSWQQRARTQTFTAKDWHYRQEERRGFIIDSNLIPRPEQILDPDSVYLRLQQEWRDFHLPVERIAVRDTGYTAVVLKRPYLSEAFALAGPAWALPQLTSLMYLENDLAFLDQPGEWYHNKHTNELFYMPQPETHMPSAVVFVPLADELLRIEGSSSTRKANSIRISGITWNNAGKWMAVNTEGMLTVQAQWYKRPILPTHKLPAAIIINQAHNIEFSSNTVRQMGSAGLWAGWGVSYLHIIGNVFKHIGDSAIVIGHPENKGIDGTGIFNADWIPTQIQIANNVVTEIAKDFRSSPGITVYYASYTRIKYNDISLMPYSGISLGWGWAEPNQILFKNKIVKNRIHHVMGSLSDGGAIYTLGNSSESIIKGNYISDQYNLYGAIYLDEGSTNWKVKRNAIESTPQWLYMWTGSIQNNTIDNNWTDNSLLTDRGYNNIITNTHAITKEVEHPALSKIIRQAGLQAPFDPLMGHRSLSAERDFERNTTRAASGVQESIIVPLP